MMAAKRRKTWLDALFLLMIIVSVLGLLYLLLHQQ